MSPPVTELLPLHSQDCSHEAADLFSLSEVSVEEGKSNHPYLENAVKLVSFSKSGV